MIDEEYLRKVLVGFKKPVIDYLLKDKDFLYKLESISSRKDLSEKEKIKEIRRLAYYYLRRFRFEEKEVSFLERGDIGSSAIIRYLEELMEKNNCFYILDVGSGLFPLTLDSWRVKPRIYIAIDKDREVIRKLEEFSGKLSQTNLIVARVDVARINDFRNFISSIDEKPCLTIYSRILHVLNRVHRINPIEIVNSSPSKIQVVLEPKTGLVKDTIIVAREKKFLLTIARKCVDLGLCYKYDFLDFPQDLGVTLYLS